MLRVAGCTAKHIIVACNGGMGITHSSAVVAMSGSAQGLTASWSGLRDHEPRLFKNDDLSDVDLVIRLRRECVGADEEEQLVAPEGACLTRFPAHRIILFGADVFKAQVRLAGH
jgi:hypothetical protein